MIADIKHQDYVAQRDYTNRRLAELNTLRCQKENRGVALHGQWTIKTTPASHETEPVSTDIKLGRGAHG